MTNDCHLLNIEELKTYFNTFEGIVKAVDDVSFSTTLMAFLFLGIIGRASVFIVIIGGTHGNEPGGVKVNVEIALDRGKISS